MSQAYVINKIYEHSAGNLHSWRYSNTNQLSLSITVEKYDIGPDELTFQRDDYPYLRIALLDKYLEKIDAEQ